MWADRGSDAGEQGVGDGGESGRFTINDGKIAAYGSFHCRIVRDLSQEREVSANIFLKSFLERRDIHMSAS